MEISQAYRFCPACGVKREKFDTSRLSPPKFYQRLLSGSGSRQGFRSTRTSRKPNETLDAFRYRSSKMVAFGEKCQKFTPLRPFRCESCGHTTFFGPVTAVGAVITNNEGLILLIQRAKEPGLGKLGMPGGFVDPNEAAEVALRREIQSQEGNSVVQVE